MRKKALFFLALLIINSCYKKNLLLDLNKPELIYKTRIKDKILYQFNEPVIDVSFNLIKNNEIMEKIFLPNIFPVSNIYLDVKYFSSTIYDNIIINALDLSQNSTVVSIAPPLINNDPAQISFNEFRIKYTKKRKQMIILKILKNGNLNGFSLVLFIRGKKNTIYFNNQKVTKDQKLNIFINIDKENLLNNKNIQFNKTEQNFYFKNRLSQSYSLLYLLDDRDNVIDYFIYYNSKNKSYEYYQDNKKFKYYMETLKFFGLTPELYDIKNSTSVKTIVRKNNTFIVKVKK